MLEWLKKLGAPAPAEVLEGEGRLQRACAELMAIAARQDDNFDEAEKGVIVALLQRRFSMPPEEATELANETVEAVPGSIDLYGLSRTIRDALPPEERVHIMEMLWEVVYADGELDDYEANLLRRVAGLLYVDDRESGTARQRVLQRHADAGHHGEGGETG